MPSNDIYTRNDDGDLAVRTVSATESSTVVNPNDVYTRDTDGNLAVRVVGSGGGDSHNKGYFATPEALRTAYPTAEAGDFAIVESTDTVWVWDSDTSAWKDSDQKGQVTSVNNQTGDVTVQETLVSGTNIKTINDTSVLGSGNIAVQETLVSGTNIKTINNTSVLGSGDITVQEQLVSGTNIKTINNQSVLGSGNLTVSGGINWTAHRDIEPNLGISEVQWAIEFDELPNGNYEVYLQSLSTMVSNDVYFPRTVKVIFEKRGSQNSKYIDGRICYVMEDTSFGGGGDWFYLNETKNQSYAGTTTSQKDLLLSGDFLNLNWWYYGFNNTKTIPNAIRATNIKNIDTGVEYPTTIIITELGELPADYQYDKYGNNITTGEITQRIEFSNCNVRNSWGIFKGVYLPGVEMYNDMDRCSGCRVIIKNSSGDVFDATTYNGFDDKNYYRIDKNEGFFENTVIKRAEYGQVYVIFNSIASVGDDYTCFVGRIGGGQLNVQVDANFVFQNQNLPTLYDVSCINVGSTVDLNNYGTVSQYTGTTNANYTKGYFYEATGTISHVSGTGEVYNISDQNVTISIDFDSLIPAIAQEYGYTDSDIAGYMNEAYTWTIQGDGTSLTNVNWEIIGDMDSPNILSCFTITGWDYTNDVTFNTRNCAAGYDEVQNGHWSQIDVQPSSGGSLPSQTGNSGKFLTTNGTDASWATISQVPSTTGTTQGDVLTVNAQGDPVWQASSGGSTGTTASLVVADWSNNSQTVNVTGVTANNNVIVAPAPASQSDYTTAGIMCTAQGAGTLTFTCTTVPSSAITVNVLII